MCGQYYVDHSTFSNIPTKQKMSPGKQIPVYLNYKDKIVMTQLTWGYNIYNKLVVNAREETLFDKPMFKDDIKTRRCIIPAKGFYQKDNLKHQISFENNTNETIYMCGIYNLNKEVVIITTEANDVMKPIHNRMPLIIPKDKVSSWLKDDTYIKELLNTQTDDIQIVSGYFQQSLL
jgi:putative SOS response-associated peptidase YedK